MKEMTAAVDRLIDGFIGGRGGMDGCMDALIVRDRYGLEKRSRVGGVFILNVEFVVW